MSKTTLFSLLFFVALHDIFAGGYFPVGNKEGEISKFESKWYEAQLRAMKEPSLFKNAGKSDFREEFRFLWLRSFHKPIAVRAYMTASGPKLHVVRLSGKGGYEPGSIEWTRDISLTDDQWKRLVKYLSADEVQYPYRGLTKEQLEMTMGFDGAQWILESAIKGRYHISQVWSPTSFERKRTLKDYDKFSLPSFQPFTKACLYLLNLAGIKNEEIY